MEEKEEEMVEEEMAVVGKVAVMGVAVMVVAGKVQDRSLLVIVEQYYL